MIDPSKIHKRIPRYKIKPRSRAAATHDVRHQIPGSPYKTVDGKRWMIGRDQNLVRIEEEKLTKKQRNKLKRAARAE